MRQWVLELKQVSGAQIVSGDSLPNYPPPVAPFADRAKQMAATLYAIRKTVAAQAATPTVHQKHGSRKKAKVFRPKRSKRPKASTGKQQLTLFDNLDPDPPSE